MTLKELRELLAGIVSQMQAIRKAATDANRQLTDDERTEIAKLTEQFETTDEQIQSLADIERAEESLTRERPRRTQANPPDDGQGRRDGGDGGDGGDTAARTRIASRDQVLDDPKRGFQNGGEYCMAVYNAGMQGSDADQRLRYLAPNPATSATEAVGADGGYLVPPDFAGDVKILLEGDESLLARTDQWPTASNTIVVPADESAPHDTTGGIQVYWTDELAQLTQSKPILEERRLRLHAMTALIPVTEDLLADGRNVDAYLRRKVPPKFVAKANTGIIRGDGVRKQLGMLTSGARVTVAKESGQAAATIVIANVTKMWSRMLSSSVMNASWLINMDVYPQLLGLTLGDQPVFMPPGGLASVSPWGTLLGRPLLPMQACSTLGTEGDIILVDLQGIWTGVKRVGDTEDLIDAAVSMHLWFDYATFAFRYRLRTDSQPWLRNQVAPEQGSANQSSIVTLATRA